ncbi:Gfo/Idh/MocA family protein [Arthrobacter caoxuetaonis]|uniref:Gfo/Idh/MocA family oxidoreductase n=1 Tax=Arthrobacter caoxuetaonis TaxID=2886935 RepID=A0A9X1MB30_9MICC|nr:Gfo/Idh/MocA family oxidoreductase [Arthrobacter caoxuetaonis]MCC3281480.1 Gfo/Idh/MocA family oxidoreductase [Arthrobacter caoxuetaonis]MCC3296266.1 Gfo/Idh/MocA family oxidoreductase [Arthrobacter caoxuetaonis]USQ56885.1 Gfo/Idh/MocA family oxidoreductase [Arthrobacter caoxuetaonis]
MTDTARTQAPRLRVGIVGCGNISRNHIEAYAAIEGTEVVGVCDVDTARVRQTAATWQIPHAVDSAAALLDLGLDIISVCTPHPTHEAVVLQAAAAGVHVLCEKPISVDLTAARNMVEACENHGVALGVLFQRRFWPAAAALRAAIDDGTLGRPVMGQVSVLLQRDPEYYRADAWRGTWANDGGGVLMTQAIHYIDLLQWYLGEVAEVYGAVNTFKHGDYIEVEDSASAVLKFTSGALATLNASTAASPSLGVQIRITGSTGATAELSEFPEGTDGRLTIAADGASAAEAPARITAGANVDLAAINEALIPHHRAQIEDFVDAVRGGGIPAVTGRDGTNALRILLAVYESARTGQPVRFAPFPAGVAVPPARSGTAAETNEPSPPAEVRPEIRANK